MTLVRKKNGRNWCRDRRYRSPPLRELPVLLCCGGRPEAPPPFTFFLLQSFSQTWSTLSPNIVGASYIRAIHPSRRATGTIAPSYRRRRKAQTTAAATVWIYEDTRKHKTTMDQPKKPPTTYAKRSLIRRSATLKPRTLRVAHIRLAGRETHIYTRNAWRLEEDRSWQSLIPVETSININKRSSGELKTHRGNK